MASSAGRASASEPGGDGRERSERGAAPAYIDEAVAILTEVLQ